MNEVYFYLRRICIFCFLGFPSIGLKHHKILLPITIYAFLLFRLNFVDGEWRPLKQLIKVDL